MKAIMFTHFFSLAMALFLLSRSASAEEKQSRKTEMENVISQTYPGGNGHQEKLGTAWRG